MSTNYLDESRDAIYRPAPTKPDWEWMFRHEVALRQVKRLSGGSVLAEGAFAVGGAASQSDGEQLLSVVASLPLGSEYPKGKAERAKLIRDGLLSTTGGRALMMPPALQDQAERRFCIVMGSLAEQAKARGDLSHIFAWLLTRPHYLEQFYILSLRSSDTGMSEDQVVSAFLASFDRGE